MSNITIYSLSDYNNGSLMPITIELDNIDYEDYQGAIVEHLDKITRRLNDGEIREEWIVADFEDVPCRFVTEFDLSEDFFSYKEALADSYLDKDMFDAGIELGINPEDVTDSYQGSFYNSTELAYDFIDSTCMLSDVPESVARYFDYESFGRDLAMDYLELNGHYFLAN